MTNGINDSTIEDMQNKLQDTTQSSDCSDNEKDTAQEAHLDDKIEAEVHICDGTGGCGKEFPHDEYGSDHRYARLCASCMSQCIDDAISTGSVEVDYDNDSTEAAKRHENIISADGMDISNSEQLAESNPTQHHSDDDEEVWSNEEEEDEKAGGESIGKDMACILCNILDTPFPNDTGSRYDVTVNGVEQVYVPVVNSQDSVSGNKKKYFELHPNPTKVLYGYIHAHGTGGRRKPTTGGDCSTTRRVRNIVWTASLDRSLSSIVKQCEGLARGGGISWVEVEKRFGKASKSQCKSRYLSLTKPVKSVLDVESAGEESEVPVVDVVDNRSPQLAEMEELILSMKKEIEVLRKEKTKEKFDVSTASTVVAIPPQQEDASPVPLHQPIANAIPKRNERVLPTAGTDSDCNSCGSDCESVHASNDSISRRHRKKKRRRHGSKAKMALYADMLLQQAEISRDRDEMEYEIKRLREENRHAKNKNYSLQLLSLMK